MAISRSIFREYDIRGIFEKELHERSVKLIGYYLGQQVGGEKIVAIGYDARSHSPILCDWLTSGLNAAGCRVLDMGMVATPVNYFANYQEIKDLIPNGQAQGTAPTRIPHLGASPDASIMITGSHNPPEYNGFKITIDRAPFFGEQIYALGDAIAADADRVIPDNSETIAIDVRTPYVAYMLEQFAHLKGFDKKIIIDCGNGVADTVLSDIFDALALSYTGLYCEPDGTFPNHHPDPSVESNLVDLKAALEREGDIAFAYDGDADRIAVLTHKHNIKGDQMALLYALGMDAPTVIGEVKCSQVMYDELERRGAKAIMYKTGHSNLKVKMRETGADLACEVSGHIFFKHRYFGYDDAIYATLRMLELIYQGIDLDKEIEALPQVFSTEEIKVETTEEEKFAIIDAVKELLQNPPADFPAIKNITDVDGVRINFEHGWGLVRASNTTPVLVTRFESTDENLAKAYERAVNELILLAQNRVRSSEFGVRENSGGRNTKIQKCLFPVAGYGTRFLPATKAIPKEMLPILTKPLIQYGVEEAVEAGCTTMAMVTSKYKKAIEDHFDTHTDIENAIAGSTKEELLDEVNSVIEHCQFSYIRQREMKGLGHAILTGEPLIGDEPFAVILADDVCSILDSEFGVGENSKGQNSESQNTELRTRNSEPQSPEPLNVLAQMTALYRQYPGYCIVAVEEVPRDQTDKYGIVRVRSSGFGVREKSGVRSSGFGVREKSGVRNSELKDPELGTRNLELYLVEDMIEKPDPSEAPSNLAIIGRYILIPEIFDILRETEPGKGGEIQITDALLTLAKQGKVLAYRFAGRRFDCGNVDGFVEATNFFYEKFRS